MKTKLLLSTFGLLVFLALMNLTPLPMLLGMEPIIHVYSYVDENGEGVLEYPEKGKTIDFEDQDYKRTFKKDYRKFWKWAEYASHPRWKLEYTDGGSSRMGGVYLTQ